MNNFNIKDLKIEVPHPKSVAFLVLKNEKKIKYNKILFTIIAVFLMLPAKQNTFAGYPVPEKLIEIIDFDVVTDDSVLVGDTIPVNV